MIIQNRIISVALTCTLKQTTKKAHKILISQNSIEVAIISVARGGPENPAPLNRNAINKKMRKTAIASLFSVSFSISASNSTRVQQ